MGVPPTAKTIEVGSTNFSKLSAGQIVKEHGESDMLGWLQQVAAVPPA
jgi:hypothetical protein